MRMIRTMHTTRQGKPPQKAARRIPGRFIIRNPLHCQKTDSSGKAFPSWDGQGKKGATRSGKKTGKPSGSFPVQIMTGSICMRHGKSMSTRCSLSQMTAGVMGAGTASKRMFPTRMRCRLSPCITQRISRCRNAGTGGPGSPSSATALPMAQNFCTCRQGGKRAAWKKKQRKWQERSGTRRRISGRKAQRRFQQGMSSAVFRQRKMEPLPFIRFGRNTAIISISMRMTRKKMPTEAPT